MITHLSYETSAAWFPTGDDSLMDQVSVHLSPRVPLEVRYRLVHGEAGIWHWVVVVLRSGWVQVHPWYWAADMSGHGRVYGDETGSTWSCGYLDPAADE